MCANGTQGGTERLGDESGKSASANGNGRRRVNGHAATTCGTSPDSGGDGVVARRGSYGGWVYFPYKLTSVGCLSAIYRDIVEYWYVECDFNQSFSTFSFIKGPQVHLCKKTIAFKAFVH